MDTLGLSEFSAKALQAQRRRDLWRLILDFAHARGIKMVSYHHYTTGTGPRSSVAIVADRFPDDWVQHYLQENLFEIDPIPT